MAEVMPHPLPRQCSLPATLPAENAVRIELEEGVPILRASDTVQARIEALLLKQRESQLSVEEEQELNRYEELDDYLSFLNRIIRNLLHAQGQQGFITVVSSS